MKRTRSTGTELDAEALLANRRIEAENARCTPGMVFPMSAIAWVLTVVTNSGLLAGRSRLPGHCDTTQARFLP